MIRCHSKPSSVCGAPSDEGIRLTTTRCGARQLDRTSYDADPEGIDVTPPGDIAQVLCLHAPQALYDLGWHLTPVPPEPVHEWVDQSVPALAQVLDAKIR